MKRKQTIFLNEIKQKKFRKGEKMIEKIKVLSEKITFGIGLTLILVSGFLFSFENGTAMIVVKGIVLFVAFIFIAAAADKRNSRMDKNK